MTSRDKVEEYDRALSTCQRILGFEMDCVLRSNVERKMGDIYIEISKHTANNDKIHNCRQVISAYQRALEAISPRHFMAAWARIKKSLGAAYLELSDLENKQRIADIRQKPS